MFSKDAVAITTSLIAIWTEHASNIPLSKQMVELRILEVLALPIQNSKQSVTSIVIVCGDVIFANCLYCLIKLLFTDFTKAKIQICKQRYILRNIKLNFRNAKIYMKLHLKYFRKPKIAPVQPEKINNHRATEPDISQRGTGSCYTKKERED